ncbi:MAG: NAD(+)/NADH kinase, partial [Rhodospirillaceae bacterium]
MAQTTIRRIGFLLNPVAGMGGLVGLKGTDGVVAEAIRRGARPVAPGRAAKALSRFSQLRAEAAAPAEIAWIACAGAMGADALHAAGFGVSETVYAPGSPRSPGSPDSDGLPGAETGRDDTIAAVRALIDAGIDLLLFCGGDGTARDICSVIGKSTPILGIPSGVKMFSGVFGTTPEHTADLLQDWLGGTLGTVEADVLDLDEERYRRGEWAVRHYHTARTPLAPEFVQASKSIGGGIGESAEKAGIAAFVREEYDSPGRLFLLGAGTTVEAVGAAFGVEKTLLGIDAAADGSQVGWDLDERGLLELLERHPDRRLVLSPIGAHGFVLGRADAP